MPCNSGVGLTPIVNGEVLEFGVNGLANGLATMADTRTWSRWDHITGECYKGELAGEQLESWPIVHTTVEAARVERPELRVHLSPTRSLFVTAGNALHPTTLHNAGVLPPGFAATMSGQVDPRLPRLTQGLAVVVGEEARFYVKDALPEAGLEDDWGGRRLRVALGRIDHVPRARWADDGTEPMQLLSRWYGFAFTWPGGDIKPAP
ncbi:MAG: DUF3179 domain-containing protein [Alphaproteobacteria bacterium]|nr:DUF3179 domain-containing protein [Alphaproteobacteria bacterium]